MDYEKHCVSLPRILIMWPTHLFYDPQTAWGQLGTKISFLTQKAPPHWLEGGHTVQFLLCLLCLLLFPRHLLWALLRQQPWRFRGPLIWPERDALSHREHFSLQALPSTQKSAALKFPAICCFAVPEEIRTPQLTTASVVCLSSCSQKSFMRKGLYLQKRWSRKF